MEFFGFLAVLVGGLNCILIAVVIFILKQPDPSKGREAAEIHELQDRITELSKQILTFEKKMEGLIQESKSENMNRLEKVTKDVSKQLKEIQDNL